jgi:hypothetical protein
MAQVFGEAGSTRALLRGLWGLGMAHVSAFRDVERLFYDFESVLAEARAHSEQLHLLAISNAQATAAALEANLAARLRTREAQLSSEREHVGVLRAALRTEMSSRLLRNLLKLPHWLGIELRHRTLTRSFEREVRRPLLRDVASCKTLHGRAAQLERDFRDSVAASLTPYLRAKAYLDSNRATFFGAKGEERVIDALRALPDEFVVLNDVLASFGRTVPWREHPGEHLRQAQIDHIVVAPDCVFLIESKNWTPDTENSATFSPQHQIKRADFIFNARAYCTFRDRKTPIRKVVVLVNGSLHAPTPYPSPHSFVYQVPLHCLGSYIRRNSSSPHPGRVSAAEIVAWIRSGGCARAG